MPPLFLRLVNFVAIVSIYIIGKSFVFHFAENLPFLVVFLTSLPSNFSHVLFVKRAQLINIFFSDTFAFL